MYSLFCELFLGWWVGGGVSYAHLCHYQCLGIIDIMITNSTCEKFNEKNNSGWGFFQQQSSNSEPRTMFSDIYTRTCGCVVVMLDLYMYMWQWCLMCLLVYFSLLKKEQQNESVLNHITTQFYRQERYAVCVVWEVYCLNACQELPYLVKEEERFHSEHCWRCTL